MQRRYFPQSAHIGEANITRAGAAMAAEFRGMFDEITDMREAIARRMRTRNENLSRAAPGDYSPDEKARMVEYGRWLAARDNQLCELQAIVHEAEKSAKALSDAI